MEEKIFSNNFTLRFQKSIIEKEYIEMKEKLHKYYVKYMTMLVFIINIGLIILFSIILKENFHLLNFKILALSTYVFSFIVLSAFIISLALSNNSKILNLINNIDYFILFFLMTNLYFVVGEFLGGIPMITYLLMGTEMIIRLVWVLLGLQGFLESFVLIIIAIIFEWVLYGNIPTKIPMKDLHLFNGTHSIIMLYVLIFSYFMIKQQKVSFFFFKNANAKAEWFSSVLENINTGYLIIKNGKVFYVNSYLYSKLETLNFTDETNEESNIRLTTCDSKIILIFIFLKRN